MKHIAIALTFGVCTVSSAKGLAQPRAAKHASHAKTAEPRAVDKQERTTYASIVALADANGDARVSETELAEVVKREVRKQAASRFRRLDRDGDGRVRAFEVPTMAGERFRRFDLDSDGSFTVAELTSVVEAQALERCRKNFARLDQDGDGALSYADAGGARPAVVSKR